MAKPAGSVGIVAAAAHSSPHIPFPQRRTSSPDYVRCPSAHHPRKTYIVDRETRRKSPGSRCQITCAYQSRILINFYTKRSCKESFNTPFNRNPTVATEISIIKKSIPAFIYSCFLHRPFFTSKRNSGKPLEEL